MFLLNKIPMFFLCVLQFITFSDSHHLTQYILQRLLGESRRESDRAAAEQRIFNSHGGGRGGGGGGDRGGGQGGDGRASIVYPQYQRRSGVDNSDNPIRRYLDEAKEHIDVIDFRRPRCVTKKIPSPLFVRSQECKVSSSVGNIPRAPVVCSGNRAQDAKSICANCPT